MEKYGFVYLWLDRKHKRYYIGSHWGTENDGYICSSTWMNSAYRRRPNDFKRRIIKRVYTSRTELLEQEYYYLALIKNEELGKKYYNIRNIKNGHWSTSEDNKLTVGEKISRARTGKKYNPRGKMPSETRDKIRSKLLGVKKSDEAIVKRSATNTGKKHKPHKKWSYPLVVCPHCNLSGSGPGMKRYHFDKCKEK